MAFKDKLHHTKMAMGEGVASYLTRIAQVKDKLATVGEVISESELGKIALKGFTKEWDVFVKCVVDRENFPDWSKLWDDFTQEKIRMGSQSSGQKENRADENVSLATKGKVKKKGNFGRDLSKVRCCCCN
jgi:hypothetical protein